MKFRESPHAMEDVQAPAIQLVMNFPQAVFKGWSFPSTAGCERIGE